VILSFVVRIKGSGFLERYLPRVVTGPVIMVIGLVLAPVGVNLALGKSGDGAFTLVAPGPAIALAAIALVPTVIAALMGRGLIRVIPILTGAAIGYAAALVMTFTAWPDLIDFSSVETATWVSMPSFVLPEWNLAAILFIVPVAIAPAIEHFGDILAIGGVTKRDYLKDPGIQNTMLGDGLATTMAGFLGGPPNTTYSEVTGAVTLTRAFNPAIMTWAAIWAIGLSFIGKLGAVFGAITVVGLTTLTGARDDLTKPRNLIIVSMILVLGIGGMQLDVGNFQLGGIGLAGIVGVLLNLILPSGEAREEPAE
jgi:uracil permease